MINSQKKISILGAFVVLTTPTFSSSVYDQILSENDCQEWVPSSLVHQLKQEPYEKLIRLFDVLIEQIYSIDRSMVVASVILDKDPTSQELITEKMHSKVDDIIEWYLDDSARHLLYDNTPFSLNALVNDLLTSMSQGKASSTQDRSLSKILTKIDELPHYQKQILEAMPSITSHNPYLLKHYLLFLSISNAEMKNLYNDN
jgi:hypothetical protein